MIFTRCSEPRCPFPYGAHFVCAIGCTTVPVEATEHQLQVLQVLLDAPQLQQHRDYFIAQRFGRLFLTCDHCASYNVEFGRWKHASNCPIAPYVPELPAPPDDELAAALCRLDVLWPVVANPTKAYEELRAAVRELVTREAQVTLHGTGHAERAEAWLRVQELL